MKLKINNKYIKLFIICLFISFFLTLLIYPKIDNNSVKDLLISFKDNLGSIHINFIISHFIILSTFIASSFFLIGFIIFPIYLIYELTTIFYSIFIFTVTFGIKGLLFSLIFNVLVKVLYIILIIYIYKNLIMIFKVLLNNLENKNNSIKIYSKKVIISTFIIIINDIIIFFFASKILSLFISLLT